MSVILADPNSSNKVHFSLKKMKGWENITKITVQRNYIQ